MSGQTPVPPELKEIIKHALTSEYTVFEIEQLDDGSYNIADITEHHRQLERQNDGPSHS